MSAAETHWFASSCYGWGTGPTRAEAIHKASIDFDTPFINRMQKSGEPGAYVWSCEVQAPQSADYRIEYYQPRGVEIARAAECFVTHRTAKTRTLYFPLGQPADGEPVAKEVAA